jgi:hypothetical protein
LHRFTSLLLCLRHATSGVLLLVFLKQKMVIKLPW